MAAGFRLALVASCALLCAAACHGALHVGYYRETCPRAEAIVRAVVAKAVRADAGAGAGVIRMLFHDCFVEGCDASVLLDASPANPKPEKQALPNNPSLRGLEVIDAAKEAVEAACPGTVSCADIVAFAARDASDILSGHAIRFKMPAGRLDGRLSNGSQTLVDLPPPFLNLKNLTASFAAKGLSVQDMVVLSGAHSIGRAHCSAFLSDRLNKTSDMDPAFKKRLRRRCHSNGNVTVPEDVVTAAALDSQYYVNVLRHRVLLTSDAALLSSKKTKRMVRRFARGDGRWERKFGKAMVKMAAIGVKTGGEGEVRKNCRVVNSNYGER
ncbi:hypothetical protein ACP4OV_010450 [Aristida adscensionis]